MGGLRRVDGVAPGASIRRRAGCGRLVGRLSSRLSNRRRTAEASDEMRRGEGPLTLQGKAFDTCAEDIG
ncbi:hypothetical protein QZM22_13090 [Burkholderia oklahomensis]|uniref:hypothetical protein n=1 Tax=Burkholderia oklahomensis TaxID=342113 RepID=UPI00264D38C5|nr:hypothetical protein [Burkholderia oklahomensis]MDN7673432.1 hypothetical protein [Burkholderia oklahomensis]